MRGCARTRTRRHLALFLLSIVSFAAPAAPFGVLTQNLDRLFDDIDNGYDEPVASSERFAARVSLATEMIGAEFGLPLIVALQEVENRNVLEKIAAQLRERYAASYVVLLTPGQDPSAINLGFLLHSDLEVRRYGQLFADLGMPGDGLPLFSRPPLYVEACHGGKCLILLNLHLRSMRGIGGADGARIRQKRLLQAETIAAWCNRLQRERPGARLLLLGDLNALTPPDKYVDVAGIIRGTPDNQGVLLYGRDLLQPDLVDLTRSIPVEERFSYVFRRRNQQLDYMFVNRAFDARLDYIGFAAIDRRFSDHAGLLARFDW